MTAQIDDYVLGRTSAEYQRLRFQAQLWEDATRRVLERAGLREGMRCVDIGCGPGEVMRLMGETAGPHGHVTGVDVDGRLGNEGLDVLRATTRSQFSFVEANVETTDEVPGAPFDLTFTRITLLHLEDPVAALRTMLRWTRPGGTVVVQDYDFRTLDIYPAHEASAEFIRIFCMVFEQAGRDLHLGHKLPSLFAEAGAGAPDGTDVSGLLTGLDLSVPMARTMYDSIFPVAQRIGLADEDKRQALFAAFDEASRAGTYTALWPLLVGAWKRKPL